MSTFPNSWRKIPPVLRELEEARILSVCAHFSIPIGGLDAFPQLVALGLEEGSLGITYPETPFVPPALGRFSRRNREGVELIRKDLPKETVYHTVQRTITDWHGGTHEVSFVIPYERFPREETPPPEHMITVTAIYGGTHWHIILSLVPLVDMNAGGWQDHLLFQLNLMLELVGTVDVIDDATKVSMLKVDKRRWEILPPGEYPIDRILERLQEKINEHPQGAIVYDLDRITFIHSFNPERVAIGSQEFHGYCLFRFSRPNGDLFVLENAKVGNAVYSFRGDWEELTRLSKRELLERAEASVRRIPHFGGWKAQVTQLLN